MALKMRRPAPWALVAALFAALSGRVLAIQLRSGAALETGDRTITKVVKLLEEMLSKSKADGNNERDLYAKYKCYCDTQKVAKEKEIEDLTKEIGLLESSIDELQASSGELSTHVAKLDADMTANVESRDKAEALRKKENEAFVAEEADLSQAIVQMTEAIDVLAEIGADQTRSVSAEHTQAMSNYDEIKGAARAALLAAKSMMSKTQVAAFDSFLQAPFTGTYTAQSGQVVGILKDMLDTFKVNLKEARMAEKAAQTAHDKFMKNMIEAHASMQVSFTKKQANLGSNDDELGTKKEQLELAETAKAAAEDFLAKLLEQCAAKKADYEKRTELRMNEEAAITEAVSILNSDAAFETFGNVASTSSGSAGGRFLQLQKRVARATPRQKAQEFLQRPGGGRGTPLLGRIAAMLQADNPFKVVLDEITKMMKIIDAEEEADDKQHGWCLVEEEKTHAEIQEKTDMIASLEGKRAYLTKLIEHPEAGLKVQISQLEEDLEENAKYQAYETEERNATHAVYKEDVKNLVEAQALLTRAVTVLKNYYANITAAEEPASFVQSRRDDPAPPETWENDSFEGRSKEGSSAVQMIEFILEETAKEENMAHSAEKSSLEEYKDMMAKLTKEAEDMGKSVATLRLELTEAEENLVLVKKDLVTTQALKVQAEKYLESIRPGCEFIKTNLDTRKAARAEEKDSLGKVSDFLKSTPKYQEAMAVAQNETYGDCVETCNVNPDRVECKACMAKTSIPGYCAGHAGTEGCPKA